MKLPRNTSGKDLIRALKRVYDYQQVHQQGSHVILQSGAPHKHRLSVPDHKALRPGTLNSILRAVAKAQKLDKKAVLRELFG